MAELSLNTDLYPWKNPAMGHPSDEDIERLASTAETDSPWLTNWAMLGGSQNALWASGLEALVYMGMTLDQVCGLGVVVYDVFGWRASGILSQCGHTIMFKGSQEYLTKYLNELPFTCKYCDKALGDTYGSN